jgi:hypothetical protein
VGSNKAEAEVFRIKNLVVPNRYQIQLVMRFHLNCRGVRRWKRKVWNFAWERENLTWWPWVAR